MGNSKMIVTLKRDVFMAHICSGCGSPLLTIVHVEAKAQKSYAFFASKAKKIAHDAAEDAFFEEVRNIEGCFIAKKLLVHTNNGDRSVSPGLFCSSSFNGIESRCPRCLNIEPWKSVFSAKKMDELTRENFPTVFIDSDSAGKWVIDETQKSAAVIDEKRKDETAVKDAVAQVIDLKAKICQWTKALNAIPETAECDKLKLELSDAENLKKQLGLLDIKRKKAIHEKIQILKLQIQDLNEISRKKKEPIDQNIFTSESQLLHLLPIAFGYTGEVASKEKGNAFAFFLAPNDIPEEIAGKIKEAENRTDSAPFADDTSKENSADTENKLFCKKCGRTLLSDSIFCTGCGARIE